MRMKALLLDQQMGEHYFYYTPTQPNLIGTNPTTKCLELFLKLLGWPPPQKKTKKTIDNNNLTINVMRRGDN